jgi:hypothetical protein
VASQFIWGAGVRWLWEIETNGALEIAGRVVRRSR